MWVKRLGETSFVSVSLEGMRVVFDLAEFVHVNPAMAADNVSLDRVVLYKITAPVNKTNKKALYYPTLEELQRDDGRYTRLENDDDDIDALCGARLLALPPHVAPSRE